MSIKDFFKLVFDGDKHTIIKARSMGNFTATRKMRAECGQFTILHPTMATKVFGLAAVQQAEKRADGFIGEDGTRDYYLGQQIPIKFIKNNPNGNRNKKTSCRANDKKRGARD